MNPFAPRPAPLRAQGCDPAPFCLLLRVLSWMDVGHGSSKLVQIRAGSLLMHESRDGPV
jgi:hypothetical protein